MSRMSELDIQIRNGECPPGFEELARRAGFPVDEIQVEIPDDIHPDDFDILFGRHSNIVECCIEHFLSGGRVAPGPCPKCEPLGLEAWQAKLHRCSRDDENCLPFLEYCDRRTIRRERQRLEDEPSQWMLCYELKPEKRALYHELGYVVAHECQEPHEHYVIVNPAFYPEGFDLVGELEAAGFTPCPAITR